MAFIIPRTLARKYTLRNALSSDFKYPSRFIAFYYFVSQRQIMINDKSKVVVITKNRFFSTKQINQNLSKNNNVAPKQAHEPFEQNKPLEFSTQKTNEYRKPTLPAFPLI